jgi:hypothetical protein
MPDQLLSPATDPGPLFDIFRGNHAMELLTVAVAHFGVFDKLAEGPVSAENLRQATGISPRPFTVLLTGLAALGLVSLRGGRVETTPIAREHLLPGLPLDVSDYFRTAADAPGVMALVERMRADKPAGIAKDDARAAFIYRDGLDSAMEEDDTARRFTLMLAGRAKNIAPALAARVDLLSARSLLDVGGGTGIYSVGFLQRYPNLRAIVYDRPSVLKVAEEFARQYGVADRLNCVAGDMFADPLPRGCDTILLSNVLHDWDVPQCRQLISKCAEYLPNGGRLLIHDCFLNDDLSGPLYPALFSVALFILTEGRNYSGAEYKSWLAEAGLVPGETHPTLVHSSVLVATKP